MRTTDDLQDSERFQPFGEKVERKPTTPAQPEWKQVDGAPKGVQVGPDGKLRTNIPQNYGCF
jgi:hypothetical protein